MQVAPSERETLAHLGELSVSALRLQRSLEAPAVIGHFELHVSGRGEQGESGAAHVGTPFNITERLLSNPVHRRRNSGRDHYPGYIDFRFHIDERALPCRIRECLEGARQAQIGRNTRMKRARNVPDLLYCRPEKLSHF